MPLFWEQGPGFPNSPRINDQSRMPSCAFLTLFQAFGVMYNYRNLEITSTSVREPIK